MDEKKIENLLKEVEELKAFRMGMLAALAAMKAALQESPGFNQQVLEDCAQYFLALPVKSEYAEDFNGPIKTLLGDRDDLLKATKHRD